MPGSGWGRGGSDERPGPVSRHRSLPVPTLGPNQIVTLAIFGVELAERPARQSWVRPAAVRHTAGPPPGSRGPKRQASVRPLSPLCAETHGQLTACLPPPRSLRYQPRCSKVARLSNTRAGVRRRARRRRMRAGAGELRDGVELLARDADERVRARVDPRATMRTILRRVPFPFARPVERPDSRRIVDTAIDVDAIVTEPRRQHVEHGLDHRVAGLVVRQVHGKQCVSAAAAARTDRPETVSQCGGREFEPRAVHQPSRS